ncbi:amino acid/amide ABC transporter membrane protein 1, HAAT family [Burkholderia sp. D7]|nr:amino acid/amide ABC transporter membrane protein 1, HAAT family [Burkholderia sp. D7]
MNAQIVLILGQDGITNGAIYALLALSILLVFSITRVLFIPQGEFVVFGALTMAAMQAGKPVRVIWLLAAFALVAVLADVWIRYGRHGRVRFTAGDVCALLYPFALALLLRVLPLAQLPIAVQALLTLAILVPLGPHIYRLFYQRIAEASVLMLMIVSIALHMALVGLGLFIFGPEGARTTPFVDYPAQVGGVNLNSQALLIVAIAVLLIVAMHQLFERTVYGKALRAVAFNRLGARLMGISPVLTGKAAFFVAALIGTLSGIVIAPLTTLYFDSGFLISLKGFVGAMIGGLVSYPIAAAGAVAVGLIEAFAAFWASPYKEIIVFTLVIPVLLWRSVTSYHLEEEE